MNHEPHKTVTLPSERYRKYQAAEIQVKRLRNHLDTLTQYDRLSVEQIERILGEPISDHQGKGNHMMASDAEIEAAAKALDHTLLLQRDLVAAARAALAAVDKVRADRERQRT